MTMSVRSCCCCCSLRTGCAVIAIFWLIWTTLATATCALILLAVFMFAGDIGAATPAYDLLDLDSELNDVMLPYLVIAGVMNLMMILTCIGLIIGIATDNPSMVQAFTVCTSLHLLVNLLGVGVIAFLTWWRDLIPDYFTYLIIGTVVIVTILLLLHIYCVLVTESYYQKLRREIGGPSAKYAAGRKTKQKGLRSSGTATLGRRLLPINEMDYSTWL